EVDVQVLEAEENPELEQELQKLDELPPDENLLVTDEPEALPDTPPDDFSADSMDLAGLAASAADSPLVMKGLFAGRTDAARASQLEKFAGGYGERVEASVVRGLEWIAAQQNPDGYWGEVSRYNKTWHGRKWTASLENEQRATRLTALCLLAFLAHGETPQSAEFGATVQRAIEYLRSQQDAETGLFVPMASSRPEKGGEDLGVYAHAQATYALAEAYALTRAPALKRPVERGLQVIIDGQLESGAWGNWYQQDISDSSATSWQIQAFKAASAAGVRMNGLEPAMEKAVAGVGYLYKGEGEWYYRKGPPIKTWSSGGPIMSGAMVLSLQLLGLQNDPMVQAGLRYMNDFGVTEWDSAWANPINKSLPATYEWYYNTQAVFQRGGSRWKTWNADFAPMLLGHQDSEGWWRGPGQTKGEETLYSTSLCTLALQVYYRILPTFQKVEIRAPKVTFDDDVIITIL
ncbi:MAG: terpene cyclase/mutase family protein, partial [Verrucomicrobia bacterium]|nr:terpene cyclase/mutase family protein [Verrucomicrobiota bacterium]